MYIFYLERTFSYLCLIESLASIGQADKVESSNLPTSSQFPTWQSSIGRGLLPENDVHGCFINKTVKIRVTGISSGSHWLPIGICENNSRASSKYAKS